MTEVIRNSVVMPPIHDLKNTSFTESDLNKPDEDGTSFAAFKLECERLGIDVDEADDAAKESLAFYKKWWWYENEDKDKMDDSSHSFGNDPRSDAFLSATSSLVVKAKTEALIALRSSYGDTSSPHFQIALKALSSIYRRTGQRVDANSLEGEWLTLSRPNFPDCLGQNMQGDFVYTLGRMSFDMFRPNNLRCSIKKIVNNISKVQLGQDDIQNLAIPRALRNTLMEIAEGNSTDQSQDGNSLSLRSFDIITYFVVEPQDSQISTSDGKAEQKISEEECIAPSKPLKAKMMNSGYLLPDPNNSKRFSVWFTGGTVSPVSRDTTLDKSNKRRSSLESVRNETKSLRNEQISGSKMNYFSDGMCCLSLQQCRLKNKQCELHGVHKLSRNKRDAVNKFKSRYKRPAYGTGYKAGLKGGLQLGNLAQPCSVEWEDIFAPEDNWRRSMGEYAKALAAKALLGAEVPDRMEDDGSMAFRLNRPIGGHIDVLYMDDDIRITKGNYGSIFVHVHNTIYKQIKVSNSK